MIDCGRGVRLRALERGDLPALAGWLDRQPDGLFVGNQDFPVNRARLERWYERAVSGEEEHLLAIEIGEQLGGYLAFRVDWHHREAQLGAILVAESHRGRGVAAAALRGLYGALFGRWQLNRVALGVHAGNAAAVALYRGLGMKEEGRLRRKFYLNGEWHDVLLYSRLNDGGLAPGQGGRSDFRGA